MRIGVIGLGYWGPNLVRNFCKNHEVEFVMGCDKDLNRINSLRNKLPNIELTNDFDKMLSLVDAVAIATQVNSHYPLAKKALEAGKHVWLEKPLTNNIEHAKELVELACVNKLCLFVDHTFIYTGAVKKIKEIVDADELGEIIYFDSVRINLGLFQNDVNVIWDLAPHDLAIMQYLMKDKKISTISAHGVASFNHVENLAYLTCRFEDKKSIAHFHLNWTSPVKIRRIIVAGKKKMLIYDDMENFEKIKIYDCGVEISSVDDIHSAKVQYRIGDMYSPKVTQTEALENGVNEFISAIKEKRQPLTNGKDGLEIVDILVNAERSIKSEGKSFPINDGFL